MTPRDANQVKARIERLALLDALRGFAILGILFVNMTWFTGFAVLPADRRAQMTTAPADAVTAWLIHFLVDGKFWSLFALLFGAGAAVQWARAQARGDDCTRLFLRRLIALIFIGLLHAVFLWFGDIVSLYAVVGLAILLFRRCSDRALLVWATLCLAVPILQGGLWLVADRALHASTAPAIDPGHGPAELLAFFSKGTYAQAFAANWAFLKERWFLALYEGRFFKLLGMFLLGYWAARRGIFHPPSRNRRLLIHVLTWGVLIGVPANVIWAQLAETLPLKPLSFSAWLLAGIKTIGVPALCLAYVAAATLLFDRLARRRGMAIFNNVGRMSLTNYVLQSIVGVTIFYGYGLGYWGRIGPTWSIVLIAVIFGAQAQVSGWWLRRFRYGPLEWAWRCVTYWRCLPLRRQSPPPPSKAAAFSSVT